MQLTGVFLTGLVELQGQPVVRPPAQSKGLSRGPAKIKHILSFTRNVDTHDIDIYLLCEELLDLLLEPWQPGPDGVGVPGEDEAEEIRVLQDEDLESCFMQETL